MSVGGVGEEGVWIVRRGWRNDSDCVLMACIMRLVRAELSLRNHFHHGGV